MFLILTIVSAAVASYAFPNTTTTNSTTSLCKVFPGDKEWPSVFEWNSLNKTISGRLVKTIPLGSPCHYPDYDQAVCEELQDEWIWESVQPCELGNYVHYAADVSGPEDIKSTIAFAREKNIRFVIRNTGHDYNGRSTGAGALSVRTHGLKDIEFIDEWASEEYTGSAVKLGAGVQGYEIMAAARDRGLVVVGGECATVGISGGYTQGGGHSALSTSYGLAADNVLEWEVITSDGELLVANETSYTDLFWALRGGGPGTYGVVTSMTIRTHPNVVVGGASLSFYSATTTTENFYQAIQSFHELLPAMVDAGGMVIHYFNTEYFMIAPFTAYNKTATESQEILTPFIQSLANLGINYTVTYSEFDTYYDHYDQYFGPLPQGNIPIGQGLFGARLIPRDVVSNITSAWQEVIELGALWIGVGTDVSPYGSTDTTSVVPAWRKALVHASITLPWNFTAPWGEMLDQADKMTQQVMPIVEAATPGSGAYVNEGDFQQPNFQDVFWGDNYAKLLGIKRKYDPQSFFYTRIAVGSEAWTVGNDGRMCRAS
ncbi:hypothetical protein TruAng_011556 [Truncatella angustata]|nr:hypothetical protein TruAng_011556 [Truncatella angustata]